MPQPEWLCRRRPLAERFARKIGACFYCASIRPARHGPCQTIFHPAAILPASPSGKISGYWVPDAPTVSTSPCPPGWEFHAEQSPGSPPPVPPARWPESAANCVFRGKSDMLPIQFGQRSDPIRTLCRRNSDSVPGNIRTVFGGRRHGVRNESERHSRSAVTRRTCHAGVLNQLLWHENRSQCVTLKTSFD